MRTLMRKQVIIANKEKDAVTMGLAVFLNKGSSDLRRLQVDFENDRLLSLVKAI